MPSSCIHPARGALLRFPCISLGTNRFVVRLDFVICSPSQIAPRLERLRYKFLLSIRLILSVVPDMLSMAILSSALNFSNVKLTRCYHSFYHHIGTPIHKGYPALETQKPRRLSPSW